MKFYIISGEASGDLHGSNLVDALLKHYPESKFRGWGGDLMQRKGVEIVKHYRELAFMGFVEVIANLRTVLRNIDFCKNDLLEYKPDAVILVDYPGFNLRIAEFAKQSGLKVIYYISPQVWAWKQSRVYKIKKVVDLMLVILPFEKDFYKKFDYEVTFVGHPLLDAIENDRNLQISEQGENLKEIQSLDERPVIALIPGSRKQEIKTMLPLMSEVAEHFKDFQFVVAAAPSIPLSFYESLSIHKSIKIIPGRFYDILKIAKAALATSGTATLETALFGVPEIVCYKGSAISFRIAKWLVKVKYIALVNLIMDREVVRELIQQDLTLHNLKLELTKILDDETCIKKLKQDYKELKLILGNAGASENAANAINTFLKMK